MRLAVDISYDWVNEIPLLAFVPREEPSHLLLIVYGGTTRINFRRRAAVFARALARKGIIAVCFEFRSNLPERKFDKFGLYDRIEDTREVLYHLDFHRRNDYHGLPVSLLGVSMGGYIAAELVSANEIHLSRLVLVAPATYPRNAIQPNVRFEDKFREILRMPRRYGDDDIFRMIARISIPTLIVEYENDEVVEEIPRLYHIAIGRGLPHPPDKKMERIPAMRFKGSFHSGSFECARKRQMLTNTVAAYLKQPAAEKST